MQQPPKLTPREKRILDFRARGMTYKEIAVALDITENTVAFHVSNILRKTAARTSAEAVFVYANASFA
jgi:DNA-binding CsgD family transcriptional regulator